jgi:hypothetical protein
LYSEKLVHDGDCDVLLGIEKEVVVAYVEALSQFRETEENSVDPPRD